MLTLQALLLPYLVALKAINPFHPKKAIRVQVLKPKILGKWSKPLNFAISLRS
jgi:hypothetical protein